MNTYWITDTAGSVKAPIEGADERDRWVRANGWVATTEPADNEQVCVRNTEHGGYGSLPFLAVPEWRHLGWVPSAPAEPVDPTKTPPAEPLPDSEPAAAAAEPTKSTKSRAASGEAKE